MTATTLDNTDLKILSNIEQNPRQSNADIAKELRSSRAAVHYRLQRLFSQGIVYGTYAWTRSHANCTFGVRIELFATGEVMRKHLFSTLKQNPQVLQLRRYAGGVLAFTVTSPFILQEITKPLCKEFKSLIKSIQFSTFLQTEHTGISCINKPGINSTKQIQQTIDRDLTTDKKDERILELLRHDARMQNKSIAKDIGLSAEAIAYRIQKLQTQSILIGAQMAINWELAKLKFTTLRIHLQQNQNTKKLLAKLRKTPCHQLRIGLGIIEADLLTEEQELFDKILWELRPELDDLGANYQIDTNGGTIWNSITKAQKKKQ